LRKRWRAASRASSVPDDPGVGSSRLRRLARPRCLRERLTTKGFRPGCCREVDVNGSKDRAKDASPADDGFIHRRRLPVLCGAGRRRSPPRRPPGIRCHRRASQRREETRIEHDGPTKAFVRASPREGRRRPESRDAFHRDIEGRRRTFIRNLRSSALSLTPPTRCPEGRAFVGQCKVTVRSPAGP
jgi:hypothetical protein